jgi:hypothetical protein
VAADTAAGPPLVDDLRAEPPLEGFLDRTAQTPEVRRPARGVRPRRATPWPSG